MKTLSTFVFAFLAFVFCDTFCVMPATHALSIDFVHIGNAGNAGELSGGSGYFSPEVIVGAVDYEYAIGKTEVTNAQYTEFLNAVAKTDPYDLFSGRQYESYSSETGITRSGTSGSYSYAVKKLGGGGGGGPPFLRSNHTTYTFANKPVAFVSWYDSIRFTNWLHNGQGLAGTPSGDTETGAYTLLGGTPIPSNWQSITRNSGAQFWIPSEDEWYKAAYHDASAGTAAVYFDYATGSDSIPNSDQPEDDPAAVNYFRDDDLANGFNDGYAVSGRTFREAQYLTDVGAYTAAKSSYGTYDQNGNLWEWNEDFTPSLFRRLRGGSGASKSPVSLSASYRDWAFSQDNLFNVGFRVATVPEPSSLLLGMLAAAGLLSTRRGRK